MKTNKVVELGEGKYGCVKCGKAFDNPNATRMHYTRVHTKAGLTGYSWKKKQKKSPRVHKWSAEQRKKFEATIKAKQSTYRKEYQRDWARRKRTGFVVYPTPGTEQLQLFTKDMARRKRTEQQAMPIRGHINFCPGCGMDIRRYEMLATTEE